MRTKNPLILVVFLGFSAAVSGCGSSNNSLPPLPTVPQGVGGVYGGVGAPLTIANCVNTYTNSQGVQVCKGSLSVSASITYFGNASVHSYGSGSGSLVLWNAFPSQGTAIALYTQEGQYIQLSPGDQVTLSASGYWSPQGHYTVFSNTCNNDDSLSSGALTFYAGGQTLVTGTSGTATVSSPGYLMVELAGASGISGCMSLSYNLTISRCQNVYGTPTSC